MPFEEREREALLRDAFACIRRAADFADRRDASPPAEARGYAIEYSKEKDRLRELSELYRAGLHVTQLSRCPFTGEAFTHSWDPFGLDGLWWDFHRPIRFEREPRGGKYHAMHGAVLLAAERAPETPFLVKPGPQRPFLAPRLMAFPSVKAVISQLPLGDHIAYPIVYFSDVPLPYDDGANEWASNRYIYFDNDGASHIEEYYDAEDQHIYDLRHWIESERVLWIAPDDPALQLNRGISGCPYLAVRGPAEVTRIMDGEVWSQA